MTNEDLRLCPFCGGEAILDDCRTIWRVTCSNDKCDAVMLGERAPEPEDDAHCDSIDWAYFEQTAIDRWNRRHKQQADVTDAEPQ